MSSKQNPPDFYDETLVGESKPNLGNQSIQTKILSRRESIATASPENTQKNNYVRPWRVSFKIEQSNVELVFEVNDRILIGRSAQTDQMFQGIDLSPFNGHTFGVSRLHAEIRQKNQQIIIIDKNSANGTLLNDQKLKPEVPYVIRHGDKLGLGNMLIRVYFLTPTFQTS